MEKNKATGKPRQAADESSLPGFRKAPFAALCIFLVMLMAGIATGEPGRVLEQAIRICLSCIGIG